MIVPGMLICNSFLISVCTFRVRAGGAIGCSECDVMSFYFCVALLMYLFVLFVACLTGFVNCLVKQFAMCLCVVDVLLMNVKDVFSVGGGALLNRLCMVFHIMCVLCL